MDARYFLKQRTSFIRFFYEESAAAFRNIQAKIEAGKSPFDDPPYSEDPEPPFLEEWMDAETGIEVLGQSCVALLSDTLKLYFNTLRERVIGFELSKDLLRLQHEQGFVAANKVALGKILQTNWSDCPVRFDVIEQIVLARNRGQHGSDLVLLKVRHDRRTLKKYPRPFFANEDELKGWMDAGENVDATFTTPSIEITQENLFAAIVEGERLSDWIEERLDKAWAWGRACFANQPYGSLIIRRTVHHFRGDLQHIRMFRTRP
jgi:hypothetical protein